MSRAARPKPVTPTALQAGGRALWDSVLKVEPNMPEWRKRILIETCRLADRLDNIDKGLTERGDGSYLETVYRDDGTVVEIVVKPALATAKGLSDQMTKQLATLRLPDAAGDKSGRQGGNPGTARGTYKTGGKVSSIDKAREQAAS